MVSKSFGISSSAAQHELTTTAKFVSQKVNAIKWSQITIQNRDAIATDALLTFLSGSWDQGKENRICLWNYAANNADLSEPDLLCSTFHSGDVNDLQIVHQQCHLTALTASSYGHLSLFKCTSDQYQPLELIHSWKNLHKWPTGATCACTSLALHGESHVGTVGADGCINFVSLNDSAPLTKIEKMDSCLTTSCIFIKTNELATVDDIGQLKVWDLRKSENKPVQIAVVSGVKSPLRCIDKHPSLSHLVVTGSEDSSICLWDMRNCRCPSSVLQAHSSDVMQVSFHPERPNNLFSCSEDGSLWHWDASALSASYSESVPWLMGESLSNKIQADQLIGDNSLSVNCFDILNNNLVCGTDAEQILTLRNINLS